MEQVMPKIMVVDDDKGATNLLEEVLSAKGFEAVIVNESSKAIQMANSTKPDAFILDLMMPEPDGFKLCRMLRADANFKSTPILIVTALGDLDSRIVARGAGADDYLTKPFNIDELASRVQALLDDVE